MSQSRPGVFNSLRMGGKNAMRSFSRTITDGIVCRSHSGKGTRWSHRRDEGDAIHPVQDRGKWLLRRGLPDEAVPEWRGCCHQEGLARQAIQGTLPLPSRSPRFTVRSDEPIAQNRELQIMRIVRHPNIVELKAFYYSNGERVRPSPRAFRGSMDSLT